VLERLVRKRAHTIRPEGRHWRRPGLVQICPDAVTLSRLISSTVHLPNINPNQRSRVT